MASDFVGILLVAIQEIVNVYATVRYTKHAAAHLRDEWVRLGEQLLMLDGMGKLGDSHKVPLQRLHELATETAAALRRYAGRSGISLRVVNFARDRDQINDLATRMASGVHELELGMSIDSAALGLRIEESHERDMADVRDALAELQASSDAKHEQTHGMLRMLLDKHLREDAQPRAEKARRLREYLISTASIPATDLVIDTSGWPLGRGAFGVVRRADYLGTPCAVKQVPVGDERAARSMLKELYALQALRHPNIVLLIGTVQVEEAGLLLPVLELAAHGSLHRVLALDTQAERDLAFGASNSLPGATTTFLRIATELAGALSFLHGKRISHGDFKSQNVLVFEGGTTKISDFGVAALSQTLRGSGLTGGGDDGGSMGTAAYMAPEVFRGSGPSSLSDVYSFGAVLAHMLFGRPPFEDLPSGFAIAITVERGERPKLPNILPEPVRAIVESCWHADAAERPSARVLQRKLVVLLREAQGRTEQALPPLVLQRMDCDPVERAEERALESSRLKAELEAELAVELEGTEPEGADGVPSAGSAVDRRKTSFAPMPSLEAGLALDAPADEEALASATADELQQMREALAKELPADDFNTIISVVQALSLASPRSTKALAEKFCVTRPGSDPRALLVNPMPWASLVSLPIETVVERVGASGLFQGLTLFLVLAEKYKAFAFSATKRVNSSRTEFAISFDREETEDNAGSVYASRLRTNQNAQEWVMYDDSNDPYGIKTGEPRRELGVVAFKKAAARTDAGPAITAELVIPRVRKDGACAQFRPAAPHESMLYLYKAGLLEHMFVLRGAVVVQPGALVELLHNEGAKKGKDPTVFRARKHSNGHWSMEYTHPLSTLQVTKTVGVAWLCQPAAVPLLCASADALLPAMPARIRSRARLRPRVSPFLRPYPAQAFEFLVAVVHNPLTAALDVPPHTGGSL
jgi:serine/threonine protein kinase